MEAHLQTGVRPSSQMPTQHQDKRPGGVTVLGDATTAFLLVREVFARIVGVTSPAGMMIAIGVLARGVYRTTGPALRKLSPQRPSVAGVMIAVAVLVGPLRAIAGERAKQTPFVGPMIALSLLAPAIRRIERLALIVRVGFRAVRHALSLDPPVR